MGEAVALEWRDVHLDPASGARFGYIQVRGGKSRYAKRNVSLTARIKEMLLSRSLESNSTLVFPGTKDKPFQVTSLDHQHVKVRHLLGLPKDFVIHSLRHTMWTRPGEAGVDASTMKQIAGQSSVTVSQRDVHPTPESTERAFERLEELNEKARSVSLMGTESPQIPLQPGNNLS